MGIKRLAPIGLVIATCIALALYWSARLPLFQGPDEIAHLDYAMYLADVGRPFHIKQAMPATRATPEIRYLANKIDYQRLRYNPYARVNADYDKLGFWRAVDAGAPRHESWSPRDGDVLPYVMFAYPVAYYAAVAVTLSVARNLTHSLAVSLISARLLNVALLSITLVFAYKIFRRHRFDRITSSLAVFGLGALPLVSTLSSYVQPDNLAFTLVTIALYLMCTLDDSKELEFFRVVALTTVLAILSFTKQQYAVACWVPTMILSFGRFAIRPDAKRARTMALILLLPLAALFLSGQLTPVSYSGGLSGLFSHGNRTPTPFGGDLESLFALFLAGVADTYVGGTAFQSFWMHFGVRGATIFPGYVVAVLAPLIIGLTLLTAVVITRVQVRIVATLLAAARRGKRVTFIRLSTGAPWIVLYCTITTEIFAIYALSRGSLALQGRYWAPVLVPLFMMVLLTVPRIVRTAHRPRIARALVTAFSAYTTVTAVAAAFALQSHFYTPSHERPYRNTVSAVDSATTDEGILQFDPALTLARTTRVSGYAIDMKTGRPADRISIRIDGRSSHINVRTHLLRPDVAEIFHDDELRESGFDLRLIPASLQPGIHVLAFYIVERDGSQLAFKDLLKINRPFKNEEHIGYVVNQNP